MIIEDILKEWRIECIPVSIKHSAWDVNDQYILKEYTDFNTLQRNIEMIKVLFESGIPVQKIVPLPNGEDFIIQKDKMYLLTTKLSGKNIDINQCDEKWLYNFGVILAKLHIAFRECESKISYCQNSLLEEMKGWVITKLYEVHPEYLCMDDVERAINELIQVYHELPKQLIHRDVHLGNFLFDKGCFTGYIDFDLSQSNVRIFDLCYFFLGIRMKEGNNRVDDKQWYQIIRHVINGYDSLTLLNKIEKESISCVMKNIELLFTAYFLKNRNELLARNSADLFTFIKDHENNIQEAINE